MATRQRFVRLRFTAKIHLELAVGTYRGRSILLLFKDAMGDRKRRYKTRKAAGKVGSITTRGLGDIPLLLTQQRKCVCGL